MNMSFGLPRFSGVSFRGTANGPEQTPNALPGDLLKGISTILNTPTQNTQTQTIKYFDDDIHVISKQKSYYNKVTSHSYKVPNGNGGVKTITVSESEPYLAREWIGVGTSVTDVSGQQVSVDAEFSLDGNLETYRDSRFVSRPQSIPAENVIKACTNLFRNVLNCIANGQEKAKVPSGTWEGCQRMDIHGNHNDPLPGA